MRLRFWLFVMDLANLLPRPRSGRVYLWAVGKASDATDWGEGAELGEGEPF